MPGAIPGRIVLAAFAALSAGLMAIGTAADVGTLPTPPLQAEPWSPPATKLPRFLVTATRIVFEQGLADPRLRVSRDRGPGRQHLGTRRRSSARTAGSCPGQRIETRTSLSAGMD